MTRVCITRTPCRSSMSGGFQTRTIVLVLIRAANSDCRLDTHGVHFLQTETQPGVAEPAVPADRFAREIVRFLKVSYNALAAAERRPVGLPLYTPAYLL